MTRRSDIRTPALALRWQSHDRHPTTTLLAIIGIPIAALVALIGLPPIDIHGPLHYLGVMGPTCGMTRGVMWSARGDILRAWQFNPASLLVVPTIIGLTGRALYGKITNRWLNLHIRWRPWFWIIPAVLILLLSVRQQLNVEFLLANPAG